MSNFLFTWESLRKLKHACTPTEPSDWVSTGDCVGAVAWRAVTVAREALLKPGVDIRLNVSADGRVRSKDPDALKYFGNLFTPYVIRLSQSSLLEGTIASVALACRRARDEQLTETSCANILASSATAEDIEDGLNHDFDSWVSSWAKFPLVGDALDFGMGEPFWATTTQMFPTGVVKILPQKDGYLATFMIEAEWESKLHAREELLAYAKPVTSPPKVI
ncbi:hypothetical protein JB92DRAFT_2894806 [Gautieria morchelliformis]|nr:hypothetical protein JB92DRAFT_2894806 [Gautieria morchelliformis]